jgi:putative transcriptional regulator
LKGIYRLFGETSRRGGIMLKSKIGELTRVSKYRREYIISELKVTQNTYSNWCTGRTFPSIDKAFQLAELLECKVDDLYERK